MTVTLLEVMAAARTHSATLAAESAGYLLLCVAELLVALPGVVEADQVELAEDGAVRSRPQRSASPAESPEASVRSLLGRLLEVSSSVGPALRRSAQPRQDVGLRALVRELETALIPVNRAAARRALSRLHRETDRAKSRGRLDFGGQVPEPAASPEPPARPLQPAAEAPAVPRKASAAPSAEPDDARDWAPPPPAVALSAPSQPASAPAEALASEVVSELSLEAMLVAAVRGALPRLQPQNSAPPSPPGARQGPASVPAFAGAPSGDDCDQSSPSTAEGDAFTKPEPVVVRARQMRTLTPRLGTLVAAASSDGEPLHTEPMPPLAFEESDVLSAEVEEVRPICLDEEDEQLAARARLSAQEASDDLRWLNAAPAPLAVEPRVSQPIESLAASREVSRDSEWPEEPAVLLHTQPLILNRVPALQEAERALADLEHAGETAPLLAEPRPEAAVEEPANALEIPVEATVSEAPDELCEVATPELPAAVHHSVWNEPEPSVLPDVVLAMARLKSGLDEDELPTRLRGVGTALLLAPNSAGALEDVSAWATEAAPEAVPPLGEQAEAWLVDAGWQSASWREEVETSANELGAWSPTVAPPAALERVHDLFDIDSAEGAAFEPSPWAPVHLPAPQSDVTDLVRRFSVTEAPSELELRYALKRLAGLELTPMPLANVVAGDGPRRR